MAAPTVSNTDLVSFTVKLNGSEMNGIYSCTSVQVYKEINKIPSAKLELFYGSETGSDNDFAMSDGSDFIPGTEIEILAGYQATVKSIFKGIIMNHGIKVRNGRAPLLELYCKDKAVKMTVGRNNAYYKDKKDSDIISTLIGNSSGLSADVGSTTVQHPALLQYYATDWDFMLTRAEVNGMIVVVDAAKVSVKAPAVSSSPVLTISYGNSILDMDIEMDAEDQVPSVETVSWDPATQAVVTSTSSNPTVNTQGNITSSTLAGVLGKSKLMLQTSGMATSDDIKNWADAQLLRSWLSRIKGTVKFQGSELAVPGSIITLDGIGERFAGDGFVTGVYHEIRSGNWTTEVTLGMDYTWFSENRNIESPPASGVIAPVQGLHAGIVKQIDQDPDGHFRVMVKLPMMQDDSGGVWARLTGFYASNAAGAFFMPEINDEVVVGFMNDDPRYPVIIGSVYSSKNAAPLTPDKANPQKAIITKEKLKLTFDDKDKIITIETPGGNKVTFSDKDKSITIADQNSNTVTMSSSGIVLDSASSVSIKAKQDIKLEATGNITLTATQDLKASGLNIAQTANMKFSAQGSAAAELTASGQVKIQGAIVMIN